MTLLLSLGTVVDMPSGVFESAGSSAPTLSGVHGTKATMLQQTCCCATSVEEGRVRLVLTVGQSTSRGAGWCWTMGLRAKSLPLSNSLTRAKASNGRWKATTA